MYKRSEGFFKGYQDINLFFQVWNNPQAQGTIIITHGHGEHSESYHRLTKAFEHDAWSIYGWDMRGHGRSEGRRGYASDFEEYCQDFKIFLDMVLSEEKVKQGPVILLGHSMGGLVTIKTILRNPDLKFDGFVASAPFLGLALGVPGWKKNGSNLLNKVLPEITLGTGVENLMLTSDPDVIREFEQDTLRHAKMSPGVFIGIQKAWEYIQPRTNEFKKPFLLLVPDKDPVCSTAESKKFFKNISSSKKEIFSYPNAKHELFNDVMRTTVYSDLKKFLDGFLDKTAKPNNGV